MKLAISNLAWPTVLNYEINEILGVYDIAVESTYQKLNAYHDAIAIQSLLPDFNNLWLNETDIRARINSLPSSIPKIFGCPKLRNTFHPKVISDIVFRQIFKDSQNLCIEPLPSSMTSYINNLNEAKDLVKGTNLKINLDLASIITNQEKVSKDYIGLIGHCHISNPGYQSVNDHHDTITETVSLLLGEGYDGFFSIEIQGDKDAAFLKEQIEKMGSLLC